MGVIDFVGADESDSRLPDINVSENIPQLDSNWLKEMDDQEKVSRNTGQGTVFAEVRKR